MEIFCNIINVFITFDQFKASVLNKSINFCCIWIKWLGEQKRLKKQQQKNIKNLTVQKLLTGSV